MLPYLEALKPNRVKIPSKVQKKILCIIEGNLELKYIVKIFQLFGYKKGCYPLTNELIKVAWGDKFPASINIVNEITCTFSGGSSVKGRRVPFPAIDAFELYSRDLTVFDSVIVLFDGDKDKDKEVEEYFINKFSIVNIKNALLVSTPCFESTLIDFCTCGACREVIESIEDGKYLCDKYKKNFSKLKCFEGVKHLIVNLDKKNIDTLKNTTSSLNFINTIIQTFIGKL